MKRMINQNKILSTKIGDDIHFYINGKEGRGIIVKMSNEYVMVAKEDGDFQDIHINDTFFVRDIIVNKTWDLMEDEERYEALVKIHAPTPRFLSKSWIELPEEIKKLLTQKTSDDDERGDVDPKDNIDEDSSGDLSSSGEYENKPAPRSYLADKPVKVNNKKNNGIEASHKKEDDMDTDWRGEKEGKSQETRDDDKKEDKKDGKEENKKTHDLKHAKEDINEHIKEMDKEKSDDFKKLKPVYEGDTKQAKKASWEIWLEDKASTGNINTKLRVDPKETTDVVTQKKLVSGGFKLNQSIAGQKEKPTIAHGKKITTRQLDTDTGRETNIREASVEEEPKTSRGKKGEKGSAWLAYFDEHKDDKKAAWQEFLDKSEQFRKIYGGKKHKKKSDVEHGKYGGISTDTAYDIPKNTGYEERPHISLEEAGRLPRVVFNEGGSELTVPKDGKKEVGTFKAPPAIQKKLDMIKEVMGITDSGATNVVYGGSDNKYATALQNSTTKGRADNQVEDRE